MRATTDLNGLLFVSISLPIVAITLELCGTAIFIAAIAVGLRFF